MNMIFNMAVIVSVSSLDCNFDANMCTWTQGLADPEGFGWYMQSGPTQSSATGPNEDHTTGTNELCHEKAYFRGFLTSSDKSRTEQP